MTDWLNILNLRGQSDIHTAYCFQQLYVVDRLQKSDVEDVALLWYIYGDFA